ncbi:TOS4 Protein TOS4 [Candida maltosa Xu316]
MSSNYQFPPSSPLIDDYNYKTSKDPFSITKPKQQVEERVGREEYPTPNPSSCLFRSSSPAREATAENEDVFKTNANTTTTTTVSINTEFNVLNPDKSVLRVPLLEGTHSHFSIGRSSQSCEYSLNSKDARISRTHMKVSYSSQQIILTCVGANGAGIIIPKSCVVYATNTNDNYLVMENTAGKSLMMMDEMKRHGELMNRKSIKLDYNHTEFFIQKGETITMPRFDNVLLQISKEIVLLNPVDVDEEITDDEAPVLIDEEKQENDDVTPIKVINSSIPSTPLKPKPVEQIEHQIEKTPSKPPIAQPKPQKLKSSFEIYHENIPVRSSTISPIPSNKIEVLSDKTNTTIKRRATSEEPENKSMMKKKKKNNKENENANESEISDLAEIQNILINHLAFSRLNSTPASFLNTISVLTSKLSLLQIRTILHNINCIGVIYRKGKDAAGKPLEEEYYYMPDQDDDKERTILVENLKGRHGGLRSCRKTHKQYYWKKPAPIKK